MFVREWPRPGAPRLHFAHATGMHGGLYGALLGRLAGRFHVVASDARGHGRTDLPADPAALTTWDVFADDLGALLDTLGGGPWLLAGHSMGATVSLRLAVARPALARAVALIEPAFVPMAAASEWRRGVPNPMVEQAARRRAVFPSREAARAAWRGRGVFAGWTDTDFDAYVADSLRDNPDQTVELACAPAYEAATFAAVAADMADLLAAWRGPLLLARGRRASTVGDHDYARVPTLAPRAIRAEFADASHFLPLERPAELADAIAVLG